MRKNLFTGLLFCAAVALSVTACKSFESVPEKAPNPEKPQLRVGLYVDRGSSGGGVFCWASLIEFSPQAELVTITGQDIRDGKLNTVDLLLMPGGYPTRQYGTMKPEGIAKLREWIKQGGCYVGTCAGMSCALNHKARLRLLPFFRRANCGGSTGTLQIEISERGAQLLGVKPGKRIIRYASGPIPQRGRNLEANSTGEVLAVYKNSISYYGKPEGGQFDRPALIYGTLGKGKVIASSYHPESWDSTHDLALGMIYAVSGVKLTPEFPVKDRRPLRVAFCTSSIMGHKPVKNMLALEYQKHIDVQYFILLDIDNGGLRHTDVLILPHGIADNNKRFFSGKSNSRWQILKEFMERGGLILASGNAAAPLPEHKNLKKLPADADFSEYLPDR